MKTTVRIAALYLLLARPAIAEERYLLPTFTDVPGAHGSIFISELSLLNAEATPIIVRGLDNPCGVATCSGLQRSVVVSPGATHMGFQKLGAPGLIIKTPVGANVRMNLRVFDLSRAHLSAGTEIPVVRETEMQMGSVFLLNVPRSGSIFRNRLRVYSFTPGRVRVIVIQQGDYTVLADFALDLRYPLDVAPNAAEFYPAFAETAEFPPSISYLRVQVEPLEGVGRLWAFTTTTNNLTQEITVVTPQP